MGTKTTRTDTGIYNPANGFQSSPWAPVGQGGFNPLMIPEFRAWAEAEAKKNGQSVDDVLLNNSRTDSTYSDEPLLKSAAKIYLPAMLAVAGGNALAGYLGTAGAAAGAETASQAGTLASAGSGVEALGSAWSPASLGLTSAVTPGITAAELASLSAALPELGTLGAGLGSLGAGSSGVEALGSAWSPEAMGLTQAVTPGVSASELAALSEALPGLSGGLAAMPELSQPYDFTKANEVLGKTLPDIPAVPTLAQVGTLPAMPDMSPPYDFTKADQVLTQTPTALPGSSWLDDIINPIKGVVKPIADAVGGGGNLAALVGAGLGAASGGGTNTATSSSKTDPRFDQYLYGTGYGDPNSILGAAQKLWQDNRSGLNPTMQQGLDMQRSALTDPAYAQSYQQMRSLGNGLMSQPVAGNPFTSGLLGPTAQAGGVGGLLGNTQSDRIKALMAGGRGLIG